MIPQRKGLASRQAHVDLPDGTVEEEHGRQAFTGRASHLYRTAPPTAWVKVEGPLRPWAFDWNQLTPADQTDPEGDPLVVLSNRDLTVLVSRRSAPDAVLRPRRRRRRRLLRPPGRGHAGDRLRPAGRSGPATTWSCPRAPPTGSSRTRPTTSSC